MDGKTILNLSAAIRSRASGLDFPQPDFTLSETIYSCH